MPKNFFIVSKGIENLYSFEFSHCNNIPDIQFFLFRNQKPNNYEKPQPHSRRHRLHRRFRRADECQYSRLCSTNVRYEYAHFKILFFSHGNEIDEDESGAFKLFGGAFLILALFSRNLFRLAKRRYV